MTLAFLHSGGVRKEEVLPRTTRTPRTFCTYFIVVRVGSWLILTSWISPTVRKDHKGRKRTNFTLTNNGSDAILYISWLGSFRTFGLEGRVPCSILSNIRHPIGLLFFLKSSISFSFNLSDRENSIAKH